MLRIGRIVACVFLAATSAQAQELAGTFEQVRVLVKAGDAVTARQGLVVVEAMKMENEITTPRAGTVSSLSVEPGQSVSTGQVICLVTQGAD